jgi:hypothetical protein
MMTEQELWRNYTASLSDGSAFASDVAILELRLRGPVLRDVVQRVSPDDRGRAPFDWDGWVEEVERDGRGWSSGEWRLYDLAAALAGDRPLKLLGTLDDLGDLLAPVSRILHRWGAPNY